MRSTFPLTVTEIERASLDDADARFLAVLAGRVPDGDAAAAWLRPLLAAGELPGELAPASATCRAWIAWADAFEHVTDASAWQPDRLTYCFDARVAAPTGDVHLVANDHAGGPVPWYAVDARAGDPANRPAATIASTNIPAGIRYRGMPARRYWELEDAAVYWPAIDAGPGDVARLLFVEFGLTFADDWLVVPVDLPAGSVARVTSLVVTDTFGVRTLVRAAADLDGRDGTWHLTELSHGADLPGPLMFLPPAIGGEMAGPPLDTIDFARDEMSNVVWGIERARRGADGCPRDITAPVSPPAPPRPADAAALVYRVGPAVPDALHPYITRSGDHGPELARARVPGAPTSPRPDLPERLAVTAVSARPRRLSTAFSLARSADGGYHLIMQRSTHFTAPVRDQGLAFDRLAEDPEDG